VHSDRGLPAMIEPLVRDEGVAGSNTVALTILLFNYIKDLVESRIEICMPFVCHHRSPGPLVRHRGACTSGRTKRARSALRLSAPFGFSAECAVTAEDVSISLPVIVN
jgi:hypothetical protein